MLMIHSDGKTKGLIAGPGGPIGAIVVWLMFFVAMFSAWATYTQVAIGLTYLTLPVLMCIPFIPLGLLSSGIPIRLQRSDYCILLIYLIAVLSGSWALDKESWDLQIYWYSICFIVYFAVRFFVSTEDRIRLVGYGVLIGVLIAGVLVSEQTNEWGDVLERQSIGELNANFTSYVLVGSLYLYLCTRRLGIIRGWARYLAFPLILFVFIKVGLLGTRGALVSIYGMCFWFLLYKYVPRVFVRLLLMVAILLVVFVSSGVVDYLLAEFDDLFGRSTGDLAGRLPAWNIARGYIFNNLLFGVGVGSFASINPLHLGAHNVFLTMLLEVGLFGFVFFIVFLFDLFSPAIKKEAVLDKRFIFGAFIFFWVPVAVSGHWELAPFSWLLLALTFNMLRLNHNNHA